MENKDFLKEIDRLSKEVKQLSKNAKVPDELLLSMISDSNNKKPQKVINFISDNQDLGLKGRAPSWIKLATYYVSKKEDN